jgi:hypothetical protein
MLSHLKQFQHGSARHIRESDANVARARDVTFEPHCTIDPYI